MDGKILFLFSILICFMIFANSQSTCPQQESCECSKLDKCLSDHSSQVETVEAGCRQNCAPLLGPNSSSILQCLTTYDSDKRKEKLLVEICLHDLTGKLCSGNSTLKHFTSVVVTEPPVPVDQTLIQQNSAFIKNYAQFNQYKKCFKICIKNSPSYATGKNAVSNCYVQMACHIADGPPTTKAAKKAAKTNCSAQVKNDKHVLKHQFAACLREALNKTAGAATTTTAPEACEKHSNEL